eukprot:gene8139-10122_t
MDEWMRQMIRLNNLLRDWMNNADIEQHSNQSTTPPIESTTSPTPSFNQRNLCENANNSNTHTHTYTYTEYTMF